MNAYKEKGGYLFYWIIIFIVAGSMFNRTRIFSCILLTIVLSNIIIQDYIYEIAALNSAIYYQILVLVIIVFDYKKVKEIVSVLFSASKTNRNLVLIILAFVIAIILKYFETKII